MFRYYVCEDPWPLIWILGGFSAFLIIVFRITQLAKFAIAALAGVGLILGLLLADALVVTDAERISGVVHELASAVEASDPDRIFPHLDLPSVSGLSGVRASHPLSLLGQRVTEEVIKRQIQASVQGYHFDFVKISGLKVEVREQSRTGKAEFKVFASAFSKNPGAGVGGRTGAGTFNSGWILLFREAAPNEWKVYDIRSANDRDSEEVRRYLQ